MNEKRNMEKKSITITDIAREAGVSVATVSRYINKDAIVREDKVEKIQAVIEKYHYMPNRAARGLKTNHSMQIMLIVPDINNPYYSRMYEVLQDSVQEDGYVVMLYNTSEKEANEFKAIDLVAGMNCDGIIFCSVSNNGKVIERLQELGKPIVVSTGFGYHIFDSVHGIIPGQGTYISTCYLIENGHRKIAYAGGSPNSILNERRLSGYCRAMEENGLIVDSQYCYSGSFDLDGGRRAGEYLLSMKERPTAITCANDMIAIGIMQYCSENRIVIPQDLSIVGMDNILMSDLIRPALTTVTNDGADFARKAVELLFDRISGRYDGEVRERFCERTLIERDSVRKI